MKRLAGIFMRPAVLWAVILSATLVATLAKANLGAGAMNNFLIFRSSFTLLVAGHNLYTPHPDLYFDLFKYSPAFALCMAPFAAMPAVAGACVWNLANAALLLYALFSVARNSVAGDRRNTQGTRQAVCMAWIVAIELLTALQNFQSNALVAAFVVLALCAFEREQPAQAAWWAVAAWIVKIYGAVVGVFFVVYAENGRFAFRFIAWAVLLFAFALCVPLVVVSPEHLLWLYGEWWKLLRGDHAASHGLSVMGMLAAFVSSDRVLSVLQALSLLVCMAPLALKQIRVSAQRKKLWVSSLLVWMVIWNHKAESPTYIIAMTGIALWFVFSELPATMKWSLLWAAIVFTSLSVTDVFPPTLRERVFEPLMVKAWPSVVIWCVMQWELWKNDARQREYHVNTA
jgi:hypothetical protein